MPADAVVLRIPRFFSVLLLVFLAFQLTGMVGNVVEERSLLALLDPPWIFSVPEFVLLAAVSIANDRLAPRLAADGIRSRGPRIFRYDVAVRWDRVERIWVNGKGLLLVRLRDPEAVAGADDRLRRHMRHRRNRFSADLTLPLMLVKPDTATIGDAIERFSGGTLRLERAGIDPVPGADDVVLQSRFALPVSLVLLTGIMTPWSVIFFRAGAPWGLGGRDLLVALAVAVLVTLVLLPPFLAVLVARIAPPILAPSGLRLRAARLSGYDAIVPWERVTGIRTSRSGPARRLLVQVRDAEALAGGDARLLRRMRRNRARHGADLVVPITGAGRDDAELAAAVSRLTGGRHTLDRSGGRDGGRAHPRTPAGS